MESDIYMNVHIFEQKDSVILKKNITLLNLSHQITTKQNNHIANRHKI